MVDTVEKVALHKIVIGSDMVRRGATFQCPVDQVEDLERLGAIALEPKPKRQRKAAAAKSK